MPFSGNPVVKQVSDRLVRLTGLTIPAGSAGALDLPGFVPPPPSPSPSLGAATTFGLAVNTVVNPAPGSTVTGDAGWVVPPATQPFVSGSIHANDATYVQAGADTATALAVLNAAPPTFSFAAGNINLSTDATHGPAGTYAPGVYVVTGNASTSVNMTLSGKGLYIFRISGTLTTANATSILLANGADPADVWWVVGGATVTLGDLTVFIGTVIPTGNCAFVVGDQSFLGGHMSWIGRALGFGAGRSFTFGEGISIQTPLIVGPPIIMPSPFNPQPYRFDGGIVTLQDAIEVEGRTRMQSGTAQAPLAVVKTGTTHADFLATVYNTSLTVTPLELELYARIHD